MTVCSVLRVFLLRIPYLKYHAGPEDVTSKHFCKIYSARKLRPRGSLKIGEYRIKIGVVGSDHSLNQKAMQHSYLRLRPCNPQQSVLQNSLSYLRPNWSSFQKINGHITGMV